MNDSQCQLRYADRAIDAPYCNATFDSLLCWPPTGANATVTMACPDKFGMDTTSNPAPLVALQDTSRAAVCPRATGPTAWASPTRPTRAATRPT